MAKQAHSGPATYLWLRARELDGTYPGGGPEVGSFVTSTMRVARGWGHIEREHWPDYFGDWPPQEPLGLDTLAKKKRINKYHRIRNAAECCKLIKSQVGAVSAGFRITDEWFNASNGVIPMPGPGKSIIGGHCVALLMVDEDEKRFLFPNSWGEKWGNRGWGSISFEFFDRFMGEAWAQLHVEKTPRQLLEMCLPPTEQRMADGVQSFGWINEDSLFDRRTFVMELYDATADERIGWVFAHDMEEWLEVEEFFVRPAYRNHGCGSTLMEMLKETRQIANKPILIWLSHPDYSPRHRATTERFLLKHGFRIHGSDVQWASAKAVLGGDIPALPLSEPPPPPTLFRGGPLELKASTNGAGKLKPFGRNRFTGL